MSFTGSPGTSSPLVLGLNDQRDDITGNVDLFVTVSQAANSGFGYSTTLFIGTQVVAISAPVPEPATLGLMAGGLLLSIAWHRRRKASLQKQTPGWPGRQWKFDFSAGCPPYR